MPELVDVLRQATEDLRPADPDALLRGALVDGAGRRRSRQVRTAMATVGLLVVVGALVVVLLNGSVGSLFSGGEEGPSAEPQPIGIARNEVGATFTQLVSGSVTEESDATAAQAHEPGGYESSFLWNGFLTTVLIAPYDGDAESLCEKRIAADVTCAQIDGGWLVQSGGDSPQSAMVDLFRRNGNHVQLTMYNTGTAPGDPGQPPPPLTVDRLVKAAASDAWFAG